MRVDGNTGNRCRPCPQAASSGDQPYHRGGNPVLFLDTLAKLSSQRCRRSRWSGSAMPSTSLRDGAPQSLAVPVGLAHLAAGGAACAGGIADAVYGAELPGAALSANWMETSRSSFWRTFHRHAIGHLSLIKRWGPQVGGYRRGVRRHPGGDASRSGRGALGSPAVAGVRRQQRGIFHHDALAGDNRNPRAELATGHSGISDHYFCPPWLYAVGPSARSLHLDDTGGNRHLRSIRPFPADPGPPARPPASVSGSLQLYADYRDGDAGLSECFGHVPSPWTFAGASIVSPSCLYLQAAERRGQCELRKA